MEWLCRLSRRMITDRRRKNNKILYRYFGSIDPYTLVRSRVNISLLSKVLILCHTIVLINLYFHIISIIKVFTNLPSRPKFWLFCTKFKIDEQLQVQISMKSDSIVQFANYRYFHSQTLCNL